MMALWLVAAQLLCLTRAGSFAGSHIWLLLMLLLQSMLRCCYEVCHAAVTKHEDKSALPSAPLQVHSGQTATAGVRIW